MKKILFLVIGFFIGFVGYAQHTPPKMGKKPIVFIDSLLVPYDTLGHINPNQIALLTVLKVEKGIAMYGNDAKDGVIYIITKPYARLHYWRYLRSVSVLYDTYFPDLQTEAQAQYILNGKVLKENYESDLAALPREKLVSITVIDKYTLNTSYGITDKDHGVVIITEPLPPAAEPVK